MPVVLVSDVTLASAALLNDSERNLYTDSVMLPYVKMANESIEQILLGYGIDMQRKSSTAIPVLAETYMLTLPNDFLMPVSLWERAEGQTRENDWVPMIEQDNLTGFILSTMLGVWSFNNNQINLAGSTQNREVKLEYERSLATTNSVNSPIDNDKLKRYLSRKTAELCARYIGRNSTDADELLSREVIPAENDLVVIFVKDLQGARKRRGSFGRGRGMGIVIR